MHSKHKLLNALFRIISLAVVTAWLMALAITSAYAQCPGQIGVNDIYDYTPQDGGYSTNLALDTYGNIYGAIGGGGSYGQGWLYKLSDRGGHWLLDPLYNFVGDSNGFGPGNVLLGPQNALYGVADGGIQCNDGYYCGLVYKVSPGPTVCTPALCSWNESTLYQFTWGGTPHTASSPLSPPLTRRGTCTAYPKLAEQAGTAQFLNFRHHRADGRRRLSIVLRVITMGAGLAVC